MIQRIQSLYLLLTALVAALFFNGEYFTFLSSSNTVMKWTISVLAVIIPILSMILIFLFSKRKTQLTLTKTLIVLIVIFIGATCYYSFCLISKYNVSFGLWGKTVIPLVQLLLAILAYLGIKRDEDLVKSYDRLR